MNYMGEAIQAVSMQNLPEVIKINFAKMGSYLQKVGITPERLVSIAINTLRDDKINKCSPVSIMGALLQAGQLGLLPNVFGESYIIPYAGQATFQIGYKGLVKLIYRNAPVEFLDANEVREKDDFDYELGERPWLKHKPNLKERGEITHFYAVLRLKGEQTSRIRVMTKAEVDEVRGFLSKAKDGKAWTNFYSEMGKKTVLVRLMKYYPLGEEITIALDADNSINEYDADNPEVLKKKERTFEERKEPETIDVNAVIADASVQPTAPYYDKPKEEVKDKLENMKTDDQGRLINPETGKPL